MGWLIFAVVVLGAAGWGLMRWRRAHDSHKARAAEREAAFVAMLAGARQADKPEEVRPDLSPPAVAQPPVPSAAAHPQQVPVAAGSSPAGAQQAYLGPRDRLLYLSLRSALPKHEVFLQGSLQRVLGSRAPARDLPLDAVICDARLRPVAVVDLMRDDDLPPVVSLKQERLQQAGIAYWRWDAQRLPRPAEIAVLLNAGVR